MDSHSFHIKLFAMNNNSLPFLSFFSPCSSFSRFGRDLCGLVTLSVPAPSLSHPGMHSSVILICHFQHFSRGWKIDKIKADAIANLFLGSKQIICGGYRHWRWNVDLIRCWHASKAGQAGIYLFNSSADHSWMIFRIYQNVLSSMHHIFWQHYENRYRFASLEYAGFDTLHHWVKQVGEL